MIKKNRRGRLSLKSVGIASSTTHPFESILFPRQNRKAMMVSREKIKSWKALESPGKSVAISSPSPPFAAETGPPFPSHRFLHKQLIEERERKRFIVIFRRLGWASISISISLWRSVIITVFCLLLLYLQQQWNLRWNRAVVCYDDSKIRGSSPVHWFLPKRKCRWVSVRATDLVSRSRSANTREEGNRGMGL